MNKKSIKIVTIIAIVMCYIACKEKTETNTELLRTDKLTIYATLQFAQSKLCDEMIPVFEKIHDCQVDIIAHTDEVALLANITAEKSTPKADIAIGVKGIQVHQVVERDIFQQYEPANLQNITNRNLLLDRRHLLTPFAYSYYAFVYDKDVVIEPPKTIGELQSAIWRRKIIMPDPNVSTTGHSLLLWSQYLFGEKGFDLFWRNNRESFIIADNLEDALDALRIGEAPILLANLTSIWYFDEIEEPDRYGVFTPDEGSFKEIEYAAIIKNATNIYLARRFIDFIISQEVQSQIPQTYWMLPIVAGIVAPTKFAEIKIPTPDITNTIFDRRDYFASRWMDGWNRTVKQRTQ